MGIDETKQKKADFHHPVPPEIVKAVIDTGGVTDGSIIPLLKGLSPLEMRIKLTVQKYRPAYKALEEARERGTKRQLKKQINAVLEAERILKFWSPWLSGDGVISADVVSLIAKGKLSEWLKQWTSKKRDDFGGLRRRLGEAFLQFGRRKPPWGKIGEAIADGIPGVWALGKGDCGDRIYQLVKRHRKQQNPLKINSLKQPLSGRLAQRNAKHLRVVRFVPPNPHTLQQEFADRQRRRMLVKKT